MKAWLRRGEGLEPFALLHLLLLTAFYWKPLTGSADLYFRDLALYFEPLTRYLGQAVLREGLLPLWNGGLYTGMPQVALGIRTCSTRSRGWWRCCHSARGWQRI